MLTLLDLRGEPDWLARLPRPGAHALEPVEAVRAILDEVRSGGDRAVRDLTRRFDGVDVADPRVPPEALAEARAGLDPPLAAALDAAAASIEAFHRSQVPAPHRFERDGIVVQEILRPVARAGLYVPGGRAAYPSTVLMTALPALAAGVPEVALCVPPGPDGTVPAVTLAAAAVAGVEEVYAVGGAQAIAALAYGTERIRPVDVVVGPGNVWVAVAKREVAGVVGVPSAFAGPSEVVVVADDSVDPGLVAVDVVVQAEHGPSGLAWLVTWSPDVAAAVTEQVAAEVAVSPRRADLEATLGTAGYAVLVDGPEQAVAVADAIAPEHLELLCRDAGELAGRVRNAGAVFCGPWSPAAVGDYLAGPSHVLPTSGTARFASVLSVFDFLRRIHVVELTPDALARVGPHVVALAEAEGLPAHADAVRRRTGAP